jgi:hypothetical protein
MKSMSFTMMTEVAVLVGAMALVSAGELILTGTTGGAF